MTLLTAVVVVETILLALLAVLVVALLRSHAEILRRLPPPDEDDADHDHVHAQRQPLALERSIGDHLPTPTGRAAVASDIAGSTLEGDQVVVSMTVGGPTVVAFLSSGCLTCRTFWRGLQPDMRQPLPADARVVVVVKDPAFESPSKLRELAPPDVPVVQSSRAWEDFGVSMSPYFCFVEGGVVRSEGAAMTWEQVGSLLRDALLDEELARQRDG